MVLTLDSVANGSSDVYCQTVVNVNKTCKELCISSPDLTPYTLAFVKNDPSTTQGRILQIAIFNRALFGSFFTRGNYSLKMKEM